jgi:molecular chaperone GrpE
MSDENGQARGTAIGGDGEAPTENTPSVSPLVMELTETNDRLLRALAEQQNVHRRAIRDQEQALRHAPADFARDLLTPIDDLERAIGSVSEEQRAEPSVAALLGGVEATRRALLDAFAKHGVERVDPLGEPFDPHHHEASFAAPSEDYPPGTVAIVVRPGYRFRDRLLRPALVGVSRADEAAS